MPTIVHGTSTDSFATDSRDFGYSYPQNLDLRPGSDLHRKILERVLRLAQSSHDAIKARHSSWNKIDETMTVYIPLSDYEKKLKQASATKPVSIVVPYSYATLETLLAYMTKAFLAGPAFQYEGVAPEDTIGAKLLEVIVNQQVRRFKSELAIHTGFRDGLVYGLHASTVVWKQKFGRKPAVRETPQFTPMGTQIGLKREKVTVDALLFEGNEILNIDPYRYLPDPMVSIHDVQKGEFVGWIDEVPISQILGEELGDPSVFNAQYLRGQHFNRSSRFSTDSSLRDKSKIRESYTNQDSRYVTRIWMYVELIPKEWGLPGTLQGNGDGMYPEKWLFCIADDRYILTAAPLGLNHDMFPVAVNAPDFDGYSISPVSRIEMTHGLQEVLNWTFNSHVTNIRKAINDMFIVDPSLINMDDLRTPEPGKLIRLRRAAWGRGVDNAVKQFAVQDVTRGNITDAGFIMDLMQKVSAATDSTMGIMRSGGERRSAAEFNGTASSAISRLEHLARITSLQYLQDLAYFHASHTQQLMSEAVYAKAVGSWPEVLTAEFGKQGGTRVSPFDILADFDVNFLDGTTPEADAGTLQFWTQAFQMVSTQPHLVQAFDVVRIFKHMARIAGAKNVNDFVLQQQVQPQLMDAAGIESGVQAGNLIPLRGVGV